jgi:putative inorganic carbon (HCO3(-)) transporter
VPEPNALKNLDRAIWILLLVFAGSVILSIAVVQSTVLLLAVLWIVKIIAADKYSLRRTPFDIAYLSFVSARILSILFSIDVSESLSAISKEIVFYVIFFIVTQEFPVTERKKTVLAVWILWAAGIGGALYGIAAAVLGYSDRATSMVSGPVTLGMYLTVMVSLVLILGRNRDFFPKPWMFWVLTAIFVCGIAATLNRIHWGVGILLFTVVGITRERKLLVFLALGAILAVASPSISGRIAASVSSFSEFMNGRDVIWMGAADRLFERPLVGFGPRTFQKVFTRMDEMRDRGVGSWHNDYLQVYMESGFLGLATFLWLFILTFRHGIAAWRRLAPDLLSRDLVLALITAMGTLAVSGLVGGFVIDPLNSLLHRFLLGLLGLIVAGQSTGKA